MAYINNREIVSQTDSAYTYGYVAVGSSYSHVQFDNFKMTSLPLECGIGKSAIVGPCYEISAPSWSFVDNTIRLRQDMQYCLSVNGTNPYHNPAIAITPCSGSPEQIFLYEQRKVIHKSTGMCLDVYGASKWPCAPVELYSCVNDAMNQEWMYDSSKGFLFTLNNGACLGVGTT